MRLAKALIRLRVCAGWSEPLLAALTMILKSHDAAQYWFTEVTKFLIYYQREGGFIQLCFVSPSRECVWAWYWSQLFSRATLLTHDWAHMHGAVVQVNSFHFGGFMTNSFCSHFKIYIE